MPRNQRDARPDGGTPVKAAAKGAGQAPAPQEVLRFLEENPGFLADNPDLLDSLRPPARVNGKGVVDFQHVLLERQRERLAAMEAERDELIHASRKNLLAQRRVHEATLALLSASSFEHLIETATVDLAVILGLDVVCIGVEASDGAVPPLRVGGLHQLEPDTVDAVLGRGRQILLRSDVEGDFAIFGTAAGLIASDALIRLNISSATPTALLALGSRQAEHFHPGQGTELLSFLAGSLEQTIRAWLDLPQ